MHDVIVRARRTADLDQCVTALNAVHHADAYPLNWPSDPYAWLSPPRLITAWVAESPSGIITGHVAIQSAADTNTDTRAGHAPLRPSAELSRLYVSPAARRRSIATILLRQACAWAVEQHYQLTLNVTDEHRSAAITFYEASGWKHTHTTDADWTTPDGNPVKLRHYIHAGQHF